MIFLAKSDRDIRHCLTKGWTCKEFTKIQQPLINERVRDNTRQFILKHKNNAIARVFNNTVHYSVMGHVGTFVETLPSEVQPNTMKQIIQLDYAYALLRLVPLYTILFRMQHSYFAMLLQTLGAEFSVCTRDTRVHLSAEDMYTKYYQEIGNTLIPRDIILRTTGNLEVSTSHGYVQYEDQEIRGISIVQKDEKGIILKSKYIINHSQYPQSLFFESTWARGMQHPLTKRQALTFLDTIKKQYKIVDVDMLNILVHLTLQSHYSKVI